VDIVGIVRLGNPVCGVFGKRALQLKLSPLKDQFVNVVQYLIKIFMADRQICIDKKNKYVYESTSLRIKIASQIFHKNKFHGFTVAHIKTFELHF